MGNTAVERCPEIAVSIYKHSPNTVICQSAVLINDTHESSLIVHNDDAASGCIEDMVIALLLAIVIHAIDIEIRIDLGLQWPKDFREI